ncbi:hypothetical protein FVE85_0968 [Porphyridium purpureum]|uniref:Phosphoribosylglycinamide synthetase N-terminal domain-containing protein n=1 Tax=Porphyridium purpureum TaxID=35688 RepID=A0A5J4Z039_PORPP|nr:hypothetical protein FVE85_0968 [Porphyridium purpureum]|eukprot:POR7819..scf208_2
MAFVGCVPSTIRAGERKACVPDGAVRLKDAAEGIRATRRRRVSQVHCRAAGSDVGADPDTGTADTPKVSARPERKTNWEDENEINQYAIGAEDRTPWGYTTWALDEAGRPLLRVLVLGAGEQENALVSEVKNTPCVGGVYCCAPPASAGDASAVTAANLSNEAVLACESSLDKVQQLVQFFHIDVVIAGPSGAFGDALEAQVQDVCERQEREFIPSSKAAQILSGEAGLQKLLEEHMRLTMRKVKWEIGELEAKNLVVKKGPFFNRLARILSDSKEDDATDSSETADNST